MKIKSFILIAFVAFGVLPALAQKSNPNNLIKVNILSPIIRTGSFFYEHKLNATSSFQLGLLFTGFKIEDAKFTGLGITPEYRKYLSESKEALQGFYLGPFLRYYNLSVKDATDKASLSTFGGGVVAGHQWIFRSNVSLDIYLGPSYSAAKIDGDDGIDGLSYFSGFGLRSGITLGIGF